MKAPLVGDLDQLGEVLLRLLRIDVRRGVVAEHAEVTVDVEVDRRRLDRALVEGLDDDPALGQRLPDRHVGENHGGDSTDAPLVASPRSRA